MRETAAVSLRHRFIAGAMVTATLCCTVLLGPAPVAASSTPFEKINAEARTAPIEVHRVRGQYSVLEGSGGNIGVLAAARHILLVDAGIAVSQPRVSNAIKQLSDAPLEYVVNTHWHWDHTDGDAWAHAAGATVVAQTNTLKHLSETIRVDEWEHTFLPVPARTRPTVVVMKSMTLNVDGQAVKLRYYGPAHTDGDLAIYFPATDILQTGDTWWNGYYPFIDYHAGGSIDGMIRAANLNIQLATDKTIVVPGHGPVGNRRDLIAFRDMLVAIRKDVAALKHAGKSLPQVVAAKPTAAFDAKWGGFVVGPALFTRLVYLGV